MCHIKLQSDYTLFKNCKYDVTGTKAVTLQYHTVSSLDNNLWQGQ